MVPFTSAERFERMLRRFLHDQSAVMVAEYALMLAILCGGFACGAYFLSDTISDAMVRAGDLISAEWQGIYSNDTVH